jgi:DNA-binding LacI/PurR family transcriptional regulator
VIQVGALNVGGGQKAGASIASMPASSRPTAVFCANDLIALGVLQEMTRNHIRGLRTSRSSDTTTQVRRLPSGLADRACDQGR